MKTALRFFSIFIFFALIFLFKITNTANAQVVGPSVTCIFDFFNVYAGTSSETTYQFMATGGYVPAEIPFNIHLSCFPGGTYQIVISSSTDGGAHFYPTRSPYSGTGTGWYGPFGPFPGDATVYKVVIQAQIAGQPADSYTCNPASCNLFRAGNGGIILPPPPATPTPTPDPMSLNCPPANGAFSSANGYQYNPTAPLLNQPFQIQFNIPGGANISNYKVVWSNVTSGTQRTFLTDLSSSYGTWVANISAQDSQFSWSLYVTVADGTDRQCINTSLFNGVGVATPGPGGHNPCIDTNGDGKIDTCPTGIGNIPTNLGDFATAVLRIALGISGGIVLILMVIGSIRVMTSSGDPKNVAAGRDMIIAALTGALFIAFSVMIMQFLGTAVVPIPGLVFGT